MIMVSCLLHIASSIYKEIVRNHLHSFQSLNELMQLSLEDFRKGIRHHL